MNNTVKELGTSLGTAVVGSVLIAAAFSGIVDRVDGMTEVKLSPDERREAVWQLQDAMEAWTPEVETEIVSSLPPAAQPQFDTIVEEASFEAQRHALDVLLGAIVLCFLLALGIGRGAAHAGDERPA